MPTPLRTCLLLALVVTTGCLTAVERTASEGVDALDGGDDAAPGPTTTPGPAPTPMSDLSADATMALPPGVTIEEVDERRLLEAHRAGYANTSFTARFTSEYFYGDERTGHEHYEYRTDGETRWFRQESELDKLHNRTYVTDGGRTYTMERLDDGRRHYGSLSDGPTQADGLRVDYLWTLLPYLELRVTDTRVVEGERRFQLSAVGAVDTARATRVPDTEHRRALSATLWVDERGRIRSLHYDTVHVGRTETLARFIVEYSVSDVGSTTATVPGWVENPTTVDGRQASRVEFSVSLVENASLALHLVTGVVPAGMFVLTPTGSTETERRLVAGDVLYLYWNATGGPYGELHVTTDRASIDRSSVVRIDSLPRRIEVKMPSMRPIWQWNATTTE